MNVFKRVDRIERLAKEVGVSVGYPLTEETAVTAGITLQRGDIAWTARTLRVAEAELRKMKRELLRIGVCLLFFFAASFAVNAQTECPADMVCITRAAAQKAVQTAAELDALKVESAAKDQAIADLRNELNQMRIRFAEMSGEASALRQAAVRADAIIDVLLKGQKKKCLPFSICVL